VKKRQKTAGGQLGGKAAVGVAVAAEEAIKDEEEI